MWTEQHRARHEAGLKQVVSSCAIEEVAGWLERADPARSAGATPTLPVVQAIAWHLRVGGGWRALPPGLPPWRTVYGWFRHWAGLGLFDRLLCDLACLRRRAAGRRRPPRLGIIDTQSVPCIPVRGPRGFDAGKRVLGRKRVALVDADGTWLAVAVLPASVQDCDTLGALDAGKAEWPSLREVVLDGGFIAARCGAWADHHGMRHRVVVRGQGQTGFVVLARRWVVEHSFGWLTHWGACCASAPDASTSPRPASPAPQSSQASRPSSIPGQPAPSQDEPTQTGSQPVRHSKLQVLGHLPD